jgi:hypothetical protein
MERIEYPSDCKRIQQILLDHYWEATLAECQRLWQDHSDNMWAGWLVLPEDDEEVWEALQTCSRIW